MDEPETLVNQRLSLDMPKTPIAHMRTGSSEHALLNDMPKPPKAHECTGSSEDALLNQCALTWFPAQPQLSLRFLSKQPLPHPDQIKVWTCHP
eukprot:7271738-Alexandrium_andersonii.AAC.1